MSSSQHFSVGAIGAGTLAQAIAGHAVAEGAAAGLEYAKCGCDLIPIVITHGCHAAV
jgi:hypothetical protein